MSRLLRAALFLLPVMMLLLHLGEFAFQPGAQYSDALISHYPNALLVQKTLRAEGTVPLWSPAILSGYPFVANPLSGLAYLPGVLAGLLPLPLGFNLALALHLVWGGVGMYLLLRREGLSEHAALLGALVFEALPKLSGHVGAGHLTLVYAAAWTPWLLYVEKRTAGSRAGWLLPGAGLGITALADARWAAYAGLLWAAYSTRLFFGRPVGQRGGWLWLASRASNLLISGLIAAPLLLPLAQYAGLSTRGLMTAQESLVLSLPPGRLLGLVFPDIGGSAEWLLYPGSVVVALFLSALLGPGTRRRGAFWIGVVLVTVIYSLGSAVPFLDAAARLPGMSLLRVPARALLLTGFGFAVLAALALDSLAAGPENRAAARRANLALFSAAAFFGLLAGGMWLAADQALLRLQFAWGAAFFGAGAALAWLANERRLRTGALVGLLISACLIDLLGVNGLSLDFRPAAEVLSQGRAAAEFLASQGPPGSFRVYSPSYSIPQHAAAGSGLELADGVDPLQLAAYVEFMRRATGVPGSGYSVTLPPFASARPANDNRDYLPDPALLGLLNVRYVAAEFPLRDDDLILLAQFNNTRVYENLAGLPRAWVQPAEVGLGETILSEAQVAAQANRVELRAEGPGLLVLSELAYPGWQVQVDGRPGRIEQAGGLLRAVRLNEGAHEVLFTYRPGLFYLGLGLAGLAWVGLLALTAAWLRARRLAFAPSADPYPSAGERAP